MLLALPSDRGCIGPERLAVAASFPLTDDKWELQTTCAAEI